MKIFGPFEHGKRVEPSAADLELLAAIQNILNGPPNLPPDDENANGANMHREPKPKEPPK